MLVVVEHRDKGYTAGTKDVYDLAIIGGGIAGLGVALEASRWGFDIALLERDKLCQATSANSLRIIHGGFRYLQHLNLKRVIASVREQEDLIQAYRPFFKTLPCSMQLAKSGIKSRMPMVMATALYNLILHMSGSSLPRATVGTKVNSLLKGHTLDWYDAQVCDPSGLVNRLRENIEGHGGKIIEGTTVKRIEIDSNLTRTFREGGVIKAKVVVNASGPWLEKVRAEVKPNLPSLNLKWCRAVNLVLEASFQLEQAIAQQSFSGRMLFIVPRERNIVALGTWYPPFNGLEAVTVSQAEIEEFLNEWAIAMPQLKFSAEQVKEVEVGVIPIRSLNNGLPNFYGFSPVMQHGRYIEILTSKFTTFALQGREVLAKAAKFLR